MPKYSSDKKKIKPFSGLGSDRYRYLGLEEAEPNLGFATEKQLPIKDQYYQLVTFDGGTLADRYWQVAPVGVITGISIYNDGILVSIGNSINKLDFRGNIIDASASGTISTITVSSPGNENEIIYSGSNGDFDTSSKLIFNSNVGILTVSDGLNVGIGGSYLTVTPLGLIGINTNNPTQELHISGDIRLTGTIYDQNNNPGNTTDILIKNSLGGLNWISQGSIRSGAGGTYTNIQYHNSSGLVDGASNFVYNPSNNRVGIGSTIPQQLLDVLGYSKFTGQTDINILNISGVGTVSKLDVNNLTTLKDLKVVGFSTFDQYIDANNGAYIDNIRIGIANDNEIDTSTGNLTLDSAGGTTNIDDNLIISGSATINSTTQSTTKDTGALIVEGGVGIEKNANIGGTLSVTGTSNLQGILTVGNDLLPTVTNTQYLGSSSLKWDRVYANVLEGNITGNAASATKLFTSRNFSVSGDTSAPAVSFDGTANVDLVTTLANSGVTASTYGSTSRVPQITVDSKGRITFATNVILDATAINAAGSNTQVQFNDGGVFGADSTFTFNKTTDTLSIINLTTSGNVTLGDTSADLVTFNSRINSSVLPSTNGTLDLGGSSNKWNNVYANNFVGAVTGNADTATKLLTSRNIAITGDLSWNVNFDGSANVTSTGTLANSGVTAGTYGSSTQVSVVVVDSKGRVTSASNQAINFSTATVAQSDTIKTVSSTATTLYPTFVDSDNSPAAYEALYTDAGISYNASTNLLTVSNITVSGISTFNGNVTLGDASSDTVTFNSRINSSVLPSTNGTLDLGGSSNKWNNVYANTFNGQFIGNADTATKLLNARNFSITGDVDAPAVSFDGTGNVNLVTTLDNSGVVANTYGSSTTVPVFAVDAKGRVTSVTNTGINFSTATVSQSDNIKTVSTSTNASFYPTFVDSNNSPAAYEALYTDAGISYNPSTNLLSLTDLTVSNTSTFNGNVTLGDASADLVTFNSRINSSVLPSTNGTLDLGGPSNEWNNIYANNFVGSITGNADTATKLLTSRNIAITGDLSWNVNFDGSANVTSTGTLANSGVVANTYGSSTTVPVFAVDAKGRVTSVTNTGINFSTATVSQSDTIKTLETITNASFYPTFVDSNNGVAAYEALYTDSGISYNPSTNLLTLTNLTISDISTFNGNVTFNSRINSSVLPSTNGTLDLGGSSSKWNNIYANNFVGAITGNSDTATKLATARNIAVTGDLSWNVNFDGSANVTSTGTLANSGVTASTYGSSTTVPVFAVDAKGRVTSVTNTGINFSGASVSQSDTIKTVSSSATVLYPTFVDSNNGVAAYEALYSDDGISYNATLNLLNVSGAVRIGAANLSSGGDYAHLATYEYYNGSSWVYSSATAGGLYQITGQAHNWYKHNGAGTHTTLLTLDASGNLVATANVTAYSDIKLKENINTIENALDKTLKLRGVTFTRKDIPEEGIQIGVIAQEVEEIIPEAVKLNIIETPEGTVDEVKTVAYGNMVGLLIEAIKEQQKTIEKLEKRIEDLENK